MKSFQKLRLWLRIFPLLSVLSLSSAARAEVSAESQELHPYYDADVRLIGERAVPKLRWFDVRLFKKAGSSPPKNVFALIRGEFNEENQVGMINTQANGKDSGEQELELKPDGSFEAQIPLRELENPFEFLAVDARGEVRTQKSQIDFWDWDDYLLSPDAPPPARLFWLGGTVGSGFSYNYDSRTSQLISLGILRGGLEAGFRLPKGFEVAVEGSADAVTFLPSFPISMRLFSFQGHVGYQLPWPNKRLKVTINAGYFFKTMLVSPALVGFYGIQGPEISPSIEYRFKHKGLLRSYFRYAPFSVVNAFGFESYNLQAGVSYYFRKIKELHRLGIRADFGYTRLTLPSTYAVFHTLAVGPCYEF